MIIMPWCTSTPQNWGLIVIYIFTPDKIWWGGDYIVASYFHSWQYLVRGWLYPGITFSLLTIFGEGGDYIVTLHLHSWQYLVMGWLYPDITFSFLTIFGEGVIISWLYIFTPYSIWWGGSYIVTLHFHSWQYLGRGWIYRSITFSLLTILGEGGDYIMTLHFHSWQYLVRGWLYRDITFSPLTKFGEGVIISWHYIFTPDKIWWGDDYIVTLHFHSWQYLVRGWLYCDITFSLLTIFGEGVIISWHYIFTPDNIWWGGDYIVTLRYIFTPDTPLESGTWGDYIWIFSLSKYIHSMNLWGWSDFV